MKKKIRVLFVVAIFLAFASQNSYSLNVFQNQGGLGSGLWSDPLNWSSGVIPVLNEDVIIAAGLTCQMDVQPPTLNSLNVQPGSILNGPVLGIYNIQVVKNIYCYGTINNPSSPAGDINLVFAGVAHKIVGNGTVNVNLLAKLSAVAPTTWISINSVVTINLTNSGNAVLNAFSGTNLNMIVAGTLSVTNGSIGVDGGTGAGIGGDINWWVYKTLSVSQSIDLTSDNNVGGGATFYTAPYISVDCGQAITNACGTDGVAFTVSEGVTWEFTNVGGGWGNLNNTNRTINVGKYPTIIFSAAGNQPVSRISSTIPTSLILSGSGLKTFNTNYSIPNTGKLEILDAAVPASGGGVVSYYGNGQLIYNSTSVQNMTNVEFPDGSGANIILANTGVVFLNATKTLNGYSLTINNGSTLNTQTYSLNFQGWNLINNGTVLGATTLTCAGPTVITQTLSGTGTIEGLNINNATGVNHTGTTNITTKLTLASGNLNNTGTINYSNGVEIINSGGSMTDGGTQNYAGIVDLNYTGSVTTTDELPTGATVINDLSINGATALATGITVHIPGTLTLNSTLDATDNNTVNIYSAIGGNLANLTSDENTTFGVLGTGAGISIPDVTYGTINMNNTNGASLSGNNTVATSVNFTSGNLTTGVNTLTVTNLNNEDAGTYLVGNAITPTYATLNSGTSYLGISFNANVTGTDMTMVRESGPGKAVVTGPVSGINRLWTLSSTAADLSVGGLMATMVFTNDDLNGKDMTNALTYEKRGSFTWNPTALVPIVATNPTIGTYSVTSSIGAHSNGWSSFQFTVSDNFNQLLPIELVSFTGEVVENTIELLWTTAMEKNNAYFSLLKSTNGVDFDEIGTVDGACNSTINIDYSFVDVNPDNGINYYILKQYDFDGASTESEMIMVVFGQSNNSVQVYPNPSVDYVNVIINSDMNDNGYITIVDISGKTVFQTEINLIKGSNNLKFNPNLPSGHYIMNYQLNNQDHKASRMCIK